MNNFPSKEEIQSARQIYLKDLEIKKLNKQKAYRLENEKRCEEFFKKTGDLLLNPEMSVENIKKPILTDCKDYSFFERTLKEAGINFESKIVTHRSRSGQNILYYIPTSGNLILTEYTF